jgi:DNA modification methylase
MMHEDVCIFYKSFPTYNPQLWERQVGANYISLYAGENHPRDLLDFRDKKGHPIPEPNMPIQTPLEAVRYFVLTYTNPGDIVLDPCSGTGSFPVTAVAEGRNFIGIDTNKLYNTMCRRRVMNMWSLLKDEQRDRLVRTGMFTNDLSTIE